MKKLLLSFAYLAFLTTFCLLSSCEKEEAITVADQPVTEVGPESYLSGLQSKIPFMSITIDQGEDRLSGWFINKRAELKSFDLKGAYQYDVLNKDITSYYIDIIHGAGEFVAKVDIVDLVEHLKTARTLNRGNIASKTSNGASVTQAFVSLAQTRFEDKDGQECGCQGGEDSSARMLYTNHVLEATGAIEYAAETNERKILVDYIKSFKEQAGN